MPWARILLLFDAFGTVFQGQISRCFRGASRRAHLAIVEVFLAMSEGLEAIFFLSFSFFLVGSVGDVSRVFLACVLHALGTNPAAVRGFRNRFPRPNFEMLSERFQTSAPGYSRSVSCDVGRPGGYLFSFVFSGFRRRRFESSSGLCFACMPWPRILLLFEAFGTVFQSQISRWCRRDSRRAYLAIVELFLAMSEGLEAIFFLSFSFFLVGSVGDVSRVLLACVLHALGTNLAAVRGFRNRFPRPNFEMLSERTWL